jgi:hypothetical protein
MARKHSKQGTKKSAVEMVAVMNPNAGERRILKNPATGEYEVTKVPDVTYTQGRAKSSTRDRGKPNTGGSKAGVKTVKPQ